MEENVKFEFEELQIKQEGTWFKRFIQSSHTKKTAIYILIGLFGGVIFTFFTEGKSFANVPMNEILKNAFTGAFLGFFITNSPCSRGKC